MRFAGVFAAVCLGAAGLGTPGLAAMIAADAGVAVAPSDITTPSRGMTMHEVNEKFGAPVNKIGPVGTPPISRWEYAGFVVYFEGDHVIHAVAAA
jgi:hypothetical protein